MHILMDLDDTLLHTCYKKDGHTYFYWTQNLEKDLGINPATLGQFFSKDLFLKSESEIRALADNYLKKNSFQISADAFLNYWVEHDSNLNNDVWKWIWDNHQQRKHHFHIASDQICVRKNYLLKKFPLWQEVFENVFTPDSLGVCKDNPVFFQKILTTIKANPSDVCLIDDRQENLDLVTKLNIKTLLFSNANALPQNPNLFPYGVQSDKGR